MIRSLVGFAIFAMVAASATILGWSVVETSTARVTGVTGNSSFLSVGTLSLDSSVDRSDLLFDASGLYPGPTLTGCVDVIYNGSIPGSIRVHGAPAGRLGLDQYLDLVLVRSPPGETCSRFDGGGQELFNGLLADLWDQHDSYDSGLVLTAAADPTTRFAVRATATVRDDNRAQGLAAEFTLTVEVRP